MTFLAEPTGPSFELRTHSPLFFAHPQKPTIQGWELVGEHSSGTFCDLFRVKPANHAVGAAYAMKVLKEDWADSELGHALLERELQVGSSVSHRHLVPVLGHGLDQNPPLIVLPWLEGVTIREYIANGNRANVSEIVRIARQIVEALGALEEAGWIHNDIQPGNLMISPQGHLTVIDLGFAMRPGRKESIFDDAITGTINYISPEKLSPAGLPDIRSDFFSLGIVLYELLGGQKPFQFEPLESLAAFYARTQGSILENMPHKSKFPEPIMRLLLDMTAMNPEKRPQDTKNLLHRLADLEAESM